MAITLENARQQLDLWLEASAALATGQSYQIGTRQLTRSNATEVLKMINYWQSTVAQLEAGSGGSMRIRRLVPRDL